MKYDFYVLCNFSYCLHHSFLTGLRGIVSGSCGCPEIRTVLMPQSRAGQLLPVLSGEIMEIPQTGVHYVRECEWMWILGFGSFDNVSW